MSSTGKNKMYKPSYKGLDQRAYSTNSNGKLPALNNPNEMVGYNHTHNHHAHEEYQQKQEIMNGPKDSNTNDYRPFLVNNLS